MKEGRTKERGKKNKFAHCHNLIMAAFIDAHPRRGGGGSDAAVPQFSRRRALVSPAPRFPIPIIFLEMKGEEGGETERDERIFAAAPISLLTEWERERGPY